MLYSKLVHIFSSNISVLAKDGEVRKKQHTRDSSDPYRIYGLRIEGTVSILLAVTTACTM
jgi:hypothetical protein